MNLYDSIIEAVEEYGLSAQERGQLYTAAIDYLYWGREPDFKMTKTAGVCYMAMHPVFEKQRAKQEAGRRGGQAKAKAKQTHSKTEAKAKANAKQTATEQEQEQELKHDSPNGESGKRPRSSKPTLDEVSDYAAELGHPTFDASHFIDYYESNGWKVGQNPMKDWEATVRRWVRNEKPKKGGEYIADYD